MANFVRFRDLRQRRRFGGRWGGPLARIGHFRLDYALARQRQRISPSLQHNFTFCFHKIHRLRSGDCKLEDGFVRSAFDGIVCDFGCDQGNDNLRALRKVIGRLAEVDVSVI